MSSRIERVMKKQRRFRLHIVRARIYEKKNKSKDQKSHLTSLTNLKQSNDIIHVNNETLGNKASTFLYNLQQETKKLTLQYTQKFQLLLIFHLILLQTHMPSKSWKPRPKVKFLPSREESSGSKSNQKRYKGEIN